MVDSVPGQRRLCAVGTGFSYKSCESEQLWSTRMSVQTVPLLSLQLFASTEEHFRPLHLSEAEDQTHSKAVLSSSVTGAVCARQSSRGFCWNWCRRTRAASCNQTVVSVSSDSEILL